MSASLNAPAEQLTFRIGTGGTEGTYLPIGSLIAEAFTGKIKLDSSENNLDTELIAFAQRSTGSVSNVSDINNGLLEAGLAQADVVHWAFNGTGPFENDKRLENVRGIATLYLESVHLIARQDSNINSVNDLVGHRVSMDEQGSGTRLVSLAILNAYGLSVDSFESVYLKATDAIERLRLDELDAIMLVAGYPVNAVSELVAEGKARLIPITGPRAESISSRFPFFSTDSFPANTYQNNNAIPTLGVPAQLIINAAMDKELVYQLTRRLWNQQTLELLQTGHPKGKDVQLDSALAGMDVPLHPGAEKYYRELGLLDAE